MVALGDIVLQAGSCLCWQGCGRAGHCPLGQCDLKWAGLGSQAAVGLDKALEVLGVECGSQRHL